MDYKNISKYTTVNTCSAIVLVVNDKLKMLTHRQQNVCKFLLPTSARNSEHNLTLNLEFLDVFCRCQL